MKKQFTELIGVCSALIILLSLTPTNTFAQYCNGSATSTFDEYIDGVTYGSFTNLDNGINVANEVTDFTSLGSIGDISPGIPSSITVDIGSPFSSDDVFVYIDYNQDGSFTVDEKVGEFTGPLDGSTDPASVDIELNVPFDAVPGETQLRVKAVFAPANDDPCTTYTWGETEDYRITIVGGDCVAPNFAFSATDNCDEGNYDLTLDINGYGSVNDVPTEFVGLQLTSLNPDEYTVPELVQSQTIDAFGNPIGTVYTALEDVPFGVTIQIEVLVDLDSPCNSSLEVVAFDECPPANDTPCTAEALECGVPVDGNTISASSQERCGFGGQRQGVWYTLEIVEASIVQLETCQGITNFDTDLSVFTGVDCNELNCFDGFSGDGYIDGESGCDVQSWAAGGPGAEFTAAPGTYYIFVHGFGTTTTGLFTLSATCEEIVCTFPEISAIAVDSEGNEITGCQEASEEFTVEGSLTGGEGNDNYNVTANGESQEVAAGGSFTFGPYTPGTTVNISAVGVEDDNCSVSTTVESEVCAPTNDTPCTAQVLDCETNLTATTIGATAPAEGEHCDASVGSPMVYYYFSNDAANTVRFSWQTCNEGTNFDSDSHLFTGDCESLECTPMEGQSSSTFNPGYIDAQLNPETGGSSATCQDATSIFATGGSVILNPGEDMYLGINSFSFSGGTGTFVLTTSCEDILCTSPEISAIAVDGEGNEITECQLFGEEFTVEGSLSGGEGNANYTVVANGESQEVAAGGSFTFGPYPAGTTVNIDADGIDDDNCSASTSAGTVICPPTNDLCEDRIPLTCGELVGGTTLGATADGTPFCGTGNTGAPGVWYSLTVAEETAVSLDLCGSGYDTKIQVFEGACDDLVCVGGNDDNFAGCDVSGLHSFIEFTADPGTEYLILVFGFGSNAGTYQMDVSCQNLACSPDVTASAVADAEGNPIEDCIEQDGEYYVSVSIANGSETESYQVSVNGEDFGAPIANDGSIVVGPIGATTVANVEVNGVNDPTCFGDAVASVANICPPANDVPCEATLLTNDGSINGPFLNDDATGDDGEVFPAATDCTLGWCDFNPAPTNSLWFEVVVPEGFTRMEISTCVAGTNHDTQLAAWRADDCNDYGTYTEVGANDDALGGCDAQIFASTMELCDLVPGETLLIQVDGFGTASGAVAITAQGIETALCDCELPVAQVSTFPECTDPDNPSYFAELVFEEFGSSESYEVSYTVDGEDFLIEALTEDLTITDIPLGDVFTITLVPSDPACASFGNLTATVSQPTTACDPDCNDVPGGPDVPGAACETIDGDPGILSEDCECIATPANDLPCNAEVMECGDIVTGSTTAASLPEDFCDFSAGSPGVWYQYTATGNGTVFLETCLAGTDFDTDSHVFTGSCEALECNNDYGGNGHIDGDSGCEFASWATGGEFPVVSGETYWIMINGFGSLTGNFELSLTCEFDDEVSIDGSVNWNSNCGERAATLELYEAGTANLAASYNVTVGADGNFSAAVAETGSHDLYLKVDGYLAKVSAGVEIALGSNAVAFGAITPGDITGNNAIGIGDFSAISTAYGTDEGDGAYNELADFNCDGTINIQDYSSFSSNYGSVGDEPGL